MDIFIRINNDYSHWFAVVFAGKTKSQIKTSIRTYYFYTTKMI